MALKPSEFGGSDTTKTLGIQPSPHVPTAEEKLRILYNEDASETEMKIIPGLDDLEIQ